MNKEQLNQKLSDLEEEAANLRSLIDGTEQRKPEAGDVWEGLSGSDWLVGESKTTLLFDTQGTNQVGYHMHSHLNTSGATYLGKFNEVYVKISDVREALSHEDHSGDSVLNGCSVWVVGHTGLEKTRKALRKLNIITD
jgi:hypothetical protein